MLNYLRIKVMYLVPLVQNVCHHVRRGRVDDRRGNNVRHVSKVLVLGNHELLVAIELANCGKMNIATVSC